MNKTRRIHKELKKHNQNFNPPYKSNTKHNFKHKEFSTHAKQTTNILSTHPTSYNKIINPLYQTQRNQSARNTRPIAELVNFNSTWQHLNMKLVGAAKLFPS